MAFSEAFQQFKESLGMAEELLKIEQNQHHNPPRANEQKAVRGLRGGAAVLLVAAFESFLRQVMEERLSEISSQHLKLSMQKLPDRMRVTHVYGSLERAMKGPPFQPAIPKAQRLIEIDRVCKIIIAGNIDPRTFSDTGSNPNSKNVKAMFSNIALEDILVRIKPAFDRKWKKPTAHTFIADKIDEIVNRRHVVAHTADALNITRSDLRESVRFLEVLASVLDLELQNHIKSLIQMCV